MLDDLSTAETVTLVAALVAAAASIITSVMTLIYGRRDKRREWARSSLAEIYVAVIEAANHMDATLNDLAYREYEADETHPENAPHYAWTKHHQDELSTALATIEKAKARVQMFAPPPLVRAIEELHSRAWIAEDYHRLADELEILEQSQSELRRALLTAARARFIEAVRMDLGVTMFPRSRRVLHRWRVLVAGSKLTARHRKALGL